MPMLNTVKLYSDSNGVKSVLTTTHREILNHLRDGKPALLLAMVESKDPGLTVYDVASGLESPVGGSLSAVNRPWFSFQVRGGLIVSPSFAKQLKIRMRNGEIGPHAFVALGTIEVSPGDHRVIVLNSWNRSLTLPKVSDLFHRPMMMLALLDSAEKVLRVFRE